jgi:5-methylcytosine-specific restriction protein A
MRSCSMVVSISLKRHHLPMPARPKLPCRYPNCRELLDKSGYCAKHQSLVRKQSDDRRGSASERGYTSKWQKAREGYLRNHPLCECEDCKSNSRVMASQVVDHIIPHRLKEAKDSGDAVRIARAIELFWDRNNWQAMSITCHNRKTAQEDGGFGRQREGGL